jgi:hypothetical protein
MWNNDVKQIGMKMKPETFFFELLQNNIPQADSDESEERSMSNGEFIAAIFVTCGVLCISVAAFHLL